MNATLYYEDFIVGQQFRAGSFDTTKDHAIAFAREYDPQYFHIDEEAAKAGLWGGLVLSGWHTAAISMRLKISTPLGRVTGGLVGLGIESIRWPQPVYPGEALSIVVTITEMRVSKSKPNFGVIRYRVETFNQRQELVMEMVTSVWVPRRAPN
jgi:acyl dehydratase